MERYSLIVVTGETAPIRRFDVRKDIVRRAILCGAIAACLVVVVSMIPEASASQAVQIGPRAGLTLGAILYEDPASTNQMELRPGLHLGGSVLWDLTRHVGAEGSLLFSQEGYRGAGAVPGDGQGGGGGLVGGP